MRKLFGTDGIRGVANVEPMTPELAMALGGAIVQEALRREEGGPAVILIGKDTRRSGDLLEHALAAGVASMGGKAHLLGVMPTPAVAYLTKSLGADLGVMISASHNPFADNGIKLFGRDGFKLSDDQEQEIEPLLQGGLSKERPQGEGVGRIFHRSDLLDQYKAFIKKTVGGELNLSGLSIVVDCANGAASAVVPSLLDDLGATVVALNVEPDGMNINDGCGSLHPEVVAKAVREHGADLGLTFDGDADRVLAVDELGTVRDGDFLLAIFARSLLEAGRLTGQVLITTVMANLGLDIAMRALGVEVVKAKVGDRYVLQEMKSRGVVLGGEQSGHIILLEHQTTGDGLLSAVHLLKILLSSGKPLSELSAVMEKRPQVLINVPVAVKGDPMAHPGLIDAIRAAEETLADSGRVLVRSSGTEPLIRVMVEGLDEETVRAQAEAVAEAVRNHLC
ncbi:MAG: phosphoglucosamine mutase [bacterium]